MALDGKEASAKSILQEISRNSNSTSIQSLCSAFQDDALNTRLELQELGCPILAETISILAKTVVDLQNELREVSESSQNDQNGQICEKCDGRGFHRVPGASLEDLHGNQLITK